MGPGDVTDKAAKFVDPAGISLGLSAREVLELALWLEKAAQFDDARMPNPMLARDLAKCYEQLGRNQEALTQLEKAARYQGPDKETDEAIIRLKQKLGISEEKKEGEGGGQGTPVTPPPGG